MIASKLTLSLRPINGGPFNCMPAREVEIESERILCNNVILPWETNYHSCRLWLIGNEYGALCAVWADCEQDAMDQMVDSDLGASFLISEEDQAAATEEEREEWVRLGNAGEPANLDHAWLQVVRLDETKDCRLLCAFAEARGCGADNLGDGRF